jgi:hypothetical protein
MCGVTSTPPYVFMAWCVIKQRDNSTFSVYFTSLSVVRLYVASNVMMVDELGRIRKAAVLAQFRQYPPAFGFRSLGCPVSGARFEQSVCGIHV